jgi:hypothetical protein
LCIEILYFISYNQYTARWELYPSNQLNKQWRKTMTDRLTDAITNRDLVAELNEMSRLNPELSLAEAVRNAQESIADRTIIEDNGGY